MMYAFTWAGEVIRGLDEGIRTMKKGEKALFTIPPALAYGKSGSPPTIPPKATLKFEVELLSWTGVRDICRDRGIVKKILTEGKGAWQNPEDLDEVLGAYPSEILVVYFIFPFGCDFEFAFLLQLSMKLD